MKVVAIADTHCSEPKLPEGDVLVAAGDYGMWGDLPEESKQIKWLGAQKKKFKNIVVIAGNHDWLAQKEPDLFRLMMQEARITYLQDSAVTIDRDTGGIIPVGSGYAPGPGVVTFYGSPWQPEFCNWAFNLPRGQALKEKWDKIPRAGLDVLITHGPPYMILDAVGVYEQLIDVAPDAEPDPVKPIRHIGCYDMGLAVREVKPKFHVFGHIHASYGQKVIDGTTFINASIMNEAYEPTRKPVVFEV